MHRLVPSFILERDAAGESSGQMQAAMLFADIAGFSAITDDLMAHGQYGSEVLATIMRRVFEPLVRRVYEQGGFITHFAGDAFMAVFPTGLGAIHESPLSALAAAWAMQTDVAALPPQHTSYGEFTLAIKVGLDFGALQWGIVRSDDGQRACYYFQGPAVDGAAAAEHVAQAGEVILSRAMFDQAGAEVNVEVEARDKHCRVVAVGDGLPGPQPVTLSDIELAQAQRFFPRSVWEMTATGEFRQVVNVFISLPTVRTQAQLAIFMQTVFDLQQRFGGLLNRVDFGDKGANLLLFWGAPVAYENDVQRGLHFILDLQAQTEVPISGGVTYREAHTGHIGSPLAEEYTCYGRGVNLAARFMTGAPRGEVWLDDNVRCAVAGQFDLEFVDQMLFKGFTEPQKVYRLVERKEEAEFGYEGALVGRDAELTTLAAFVRPILAGQFAGMLVVYGEPGIGKSRLIHEFLTAVGGPQSAVGGHFQWFVCQTDQILRESLNPFRYWLKHYFGVSDAVAEARNKRSFNRALDDLIACTDDKRLAGELDRTRSFLGALVGLHWADSLYEQVSAEGRFENTLTGLTMLLQAESLRRPVIIFLEDAHWLDDDSKAFLPRLMRAAGAESPRLYPIAILTAARYEGVGLPLEGFTYQQVDLGHLSKASLAALAENLLAGSAAPTLLDLLERRAEGNPFFAEQLLRYLREQGLIVREDGMWHLVMADGRTPLPATIHAVLVARLDRLTEDVREVVHAAAVLGREFEVQLLAKMLTSPDLGGFRKASEVSADVLVAEQAAIWARLSQIRYIFRHALVRDAAYDMQVRSRRAQLHGIAAEALETVFAADLASHCGEIGYHYEAAYWLGMAEVRERAKDYLLRAGHGARERWENAAGIDYATRALALMPEEALADRFEALILRFRLELRRGAVDGAASDLVAAEQLAETLDDGARARAAFWRGRLCHDTAAYEAGLAAAQRCVALAQAAADPYTETLGHSIWGDILYRLGRYRESIERGEVALALSREHNYRDQTPEILNSMAWSLERLGDYGRGHAALDEALVIHREERDPGGQAGVLNSLALIADARGDYGESTALYREALDLARQAGLVGLQARILSNLGWVLVCLADYEEARRTYVEALRIDRETRARDSESIALNNLGCLFARLGDFPQARSCLEQGRAIAEEISLRVLVTEATLNLGLIHLHLGEYAAARQVIEQGLALADTIASKAHQGTGQINLGYALLGVGEPAAAQDAFRAAVALREALGQSAAIMEARAGLAAALLAAGDQPAALSEAAAVAEHVGHVPGISEMPGTSHGLDGTDEPLRVYATLYQVLAAAGDGRATDILRRAYALLMAQADRLDDPETRQRFLENIPHHREIVAASIGRVANSPDNSGRSPRPS